MKETYESRKREWRMLEGNALVDFLRSEPWESMYYAPPQAAFDAPGMLVYLERKMLPWLTERLYRGWGEVVELGTFIGASGICLASGLEKNEFVAQKEGRIHSYDRFSGQYETEWITSNTSFALDEDGGFFSVYEQLTAPYKRYIRVNRGDLQAAVYESPIEILFVDVLKVPSLTTKVVQAFFPFLKAGSSVVVMQDYLFHTLPYSTLLIEHFSEYFERAGDTGRNSVLFVNTKPIPSEMIREFSYESMPESLRLHYLMRALPKQRTTIQREFIANQIAGFVSGRYR